jgi:hypothetical protein
MGILARKAALALLKSGGAEVLSMLAAAADMQMPRKKQVRYAGVCVGDPSGTKGVNPQER